MLSQISQSQKITYWMIQFIRNFQKRKSIKQISGCQGLQKGEWEVTANMYCFSFCGDSDELKVDDAMAAELY